MAVGGQLHCPVVYPGNRAHVAHWAACTVGPSADVHIREQKVSCLYQKSSNFSRRCSLPPGQ